MPVRPQAQVDEIEDRRRSGEQPQSCGVVRGRGLQIGKLHRHRLDLLRGQRCMIEKAFAQMGEIPVRMSGRSNALVDLNDMNRGPPHVRGRERA
jgi:hypothetical protein